MVNRENTGIRVAELFAGVGGFRLGLEGWTGDSIAPAHLPAAGPFEVVWANQWEPPGTVSRQFAARCYETHFGAGSVINRDIAAVLDDAEAGRLQIPDVDLVVGGFPCQDYSVAKPLSFSGGIEGKKGVLWWQIHRFLQMKKPRFVLLENVDRILKSPAKQRGRDFAIILSSLTREGYCVSWRMVNSGEYGFAQRRKRLFIFAELAGRPEGGVFTKIFPDAFPALLEGEFSEFDIDSDTYKVSRDFGKGLKVSPFLEVGIMQAGHVTTVKVRENYDGPRRTLGDVLVSEDRVPDVFRIREDSLGRWRYLKGSKREERTNKTTGYTYVYSEGAMSFPDSLDKPSRTILTGEGGSSPSRFKHVVETSPGCFRRLVPVELEALQGFPSGWTDTGMTDGNRAFCMGNALVVGVVHRIGRVLTSRLAKDQQAETFISEPKSESAAA